MESSIDPIPEGASLIYTYAVLLHLLSPKDVAGYDVVDVAIYI